MSSKKVYPISESFKGTLRSADSFRIALKLNRELKDLLDATDSEVEIIILLISNNESMDIDSISKEITYVSKKHMKQLIRDLLEDGLIQSHTSNGSVGYTVSNSVINSVQSIVR